MMRKPIVVSIAAVLAVGLLAGLAYGVGRGPEPSGSLAPAIVASARAAHHLDHARHQASVTSGDHVHAWMRDRDREHATPAASVGPTPSHDRWMGEDHPWEPHQGTHRVEAGHHERHHAHHHDGHGDHDCP